MLKGSCLCQAVRYEVDRLDQLIGHCHCVSCRKAHAAAFNTYAGVDRPNFRWAAGAEKLSSSDISHMPSPSEHLERTIPPVLGGDQYPLSRDRAVRHATGDVFAVPTRIPPSLPASGLSSPADSLRGQ